MFVWVPIQIKLFILKSSSLLPAVVAAFLLVLHLVPATDLFLHGSPTHAARARLSSGSCALVAWLTSGSVTLMAHLWDRRARVQIIEKYLGFKLCILHRQDGHFNSLCNGNYWVHPNCILWKHYCEFVKNKIKAEEIGWTYRYGCCVRHLVRLDVVTELFIRKHLYVPPGGSAAILWTVHVPSVVRTVCPPGASPLVKCLQAVLEYVAIFGVS